MQRYIRVLICRGVDLPFRLLSVPAPLDVTRCVFMRDFAVLLTCLLSQTLSHRATEPLNRDTIVQKERDFIHSLSLLFVTEERWGRVQSLKSRQLMAKRWFNGCRKERRERIRRLECFLSALSLFSFSHFYKLFKEKSCRHFKEATFSSLNCQRSPPSHLIYIRGHLQNWEWSPCILFTIVPNSKPVFLSDTEGSRGRHFIHTNTSEAEVTGRTEM